MKKKTVIIILSLICLALLFILGAYSLRNEWKKGYESGYKQSELEKEDALIGIGEAYEVNDSSESEAEIYNRGYNDGLNDPIAYERGYADGYEACFNCEESDVVFAYYSGKFTAKVVCLLEDNYSIEGKSVAYLSSLFRPFIVYFDHDMTGELEEGKEYVFEIKPFSYPYVVGTPEYNFEEFSEKLRVTSFYEASENEKGRNGLWIAPEYFREDPLNK